MFSLDRPADRKPLQDLPLIRKKANLLASGDVFRWRWSPQLLTCVSSGYSRRAGRVWIISMNAEAELGRTTFPGSSEETVEVIQKEDDG